MLIIKKIEDNVKPKVAIWIDTGWAFGRIHSAIIKYLSSSYDFTWYDWSQPDMNVKLWRNEEWRNYDIILGNSALITNTIEGGWLKEPLPKELLDKMIPVLHCPILGHKHFIEKILPTYKQGPLYCATTPEGVNNIKKNYNIDAELLPVGVDIDDFPTIRKVTQINKLGFVGDPNMPGSINEIKRVDQFKDIVNKSGLESEYLYGKDYKLNYKLYENIDMLICTSEFEGGPLGILEAAACGIPVISTNVGTIQYLKKIRTFETVKEAVNIIAELNNDADLLAKYIKDVSTEVREEWDWEKLCKDYWTPMFQKRIGRILNIFNLGGNNFGDAVNKIFWEKISDKKIQYNPNNLHYITTGSIMCLVKKESIIFGTGFISQSGDIGGNNFQSKNSIIYNKPHKVIAVRGPLTRNKLIENNIQCPENYGDPLILMPCIYDKYLTINEDIIGIIPHYIDKGNNNVMILKKNLEENGYKTKIIDIETGNNYSKIIDEINHCKYIISSSLHGIIMGIVYKRKTCFLEFSNNVVGDQFKFNDFFQSININFKYKHLCNSEILNNYINLDYKNLIQMGINLINICPFIDSERKKYLLYKYKNFYFKKNISLQQ